MEVQLGDVRVNVSNSQPDGEFVGTLDQILRLLLGLIYLETLRHRGDELEVCAVQTLIRVKEKPPSIRWKISKPGKCPDGVNTQV
jgi:hypothetical protein